MRNVFFFLTVTSLIMMTDSQNLNAAETQTNLDWITFSLSMPKTNLVLGDKILASMVCSNALDSEYYLRPAHGDPCGFGFGEFMITEMTSGKKVECKYSRNDRAPYSYSLGVLEGHKVQGFANDLAHGYAITNAGVYIVQAVGNFRSNKPPCQYFNVITPPLVIQISPKVETNTVPK